MPNALDMTKFHKCKTTHCRAGWIEILAGKDGKKLVEQTGNVFAAMQIYHISSPNISVSPVRFFETNEQAMADMQKCAEEEKKLNQQTLQL